MKYKFDYLDTDGITTLTHSFEQGYHAPKLTLGGRPDFKLIRPFGSSSVFQVGSSVASATPFEIVGAIQSADVLTDLNTLTTRLAAATKLYREEDDGTIGSYVECEAASIPLENLLNIGEDPKISLLTIRVFFWPKSNTWKLVSDDSETII